MSADPLAVLARIERQKLDALRGAVVTAQGARQQLAAAAEAHRAAWHDAMGLAASAESGLDLWGQVARGAQRLLEQAETRCQAQTQALELAQSALHDHLVELKRLEVLAGRRAVRRAESLAAAERRMLDELAVLRHGRVLPCGRNRSGGGDV